MCVYVVYVCICVCICSICSICVCVCSRMENEEDSRKGEREREREREGGVDKIGRRRRSIRRDEKKKSSRLLRMELSVFLFVPFPPPLLRFFPFCSSSESGFSFFFLFRFLRMFEEVALENLESRYST